MPLHETSPGAGNEQWREVIVPGFGFTQVAGTWSQNYDNSAYMRGYLYNSTSTQNDEVTFPVVLSAGTWRLDISYVKSASGGIATFSLAGSSIGTVDMYNGTTQYDQTTSITGISVTSTSKITLSVKAATKNASSAAYQIILPILVFTRTA